MDGIAFQPDNSALDPRVLVSAAQLLPNVDGSLRAPYPKVAGGIDSQSSGGSIQFLDGFLSVNSSGAKRIVMGTGLNIAPPNTLATLYAVDEGATSWNGYGQTIATASAGPGGVADGWTFCQYDNQILAARKTYPIKTATTGSFATLANAPHAQCVESFNDAVWAWNVFSGSTDYPDEVWISDIGDPTTWTPSAGVNFAFTQQLTECPGPGTAMIRYRDFVVLFKGRGMWIAQYVGGDDIYEISLFSANVGCVGPHACRVAEDTLYFADDQNVYAFDGATIRSISDGEFITKTLTQAILNVGVSGSVARLQMHYDDINKVLSLYGPDSSGNPRNQAYCYSVVSGRWGKQDAGAQTAGIVAFMLNGPADELIGFGNLGVTATSNENRVHAACTSSVFTVALQNGHNSDTAGAAVTAFFGSPFQAQTLRQVFMSADDNTGVTVADTARRSPRASGTQQGTAPAASFSTDMFAYLQCDGNFHKLTFAWNAQTNGSPAAFRKWRGFDAELLRSGTK